MTGRPNGDAFPRTAPYCRGPALFSPGVANVTQSQIIADVWTVEPEGHGDERGRFYETYRRSWFPLGREMVQGNRSDQAACTTTCIRRTTGCAREAGPGWSCTTCAWGRPATGRPRSSRSARTIVEGC